jgi:phosphoenolpyruvate carboxylase
VRNLGGDVALLSRLEQEFERTVNAVLQIRESDVLLRDNHVLRSAIALRNPYVDPLSLIQIAFMKRKEHLGDADERERAQVEAVLATTVNGIAQGLRNTG